MGITTILALHFGQNFTLATVDTCAPVFILWMVTGGRQGHPMD
jgi:hypothetical protein